MHLQTARVPVPLLGAVCLAGTAYGLVRVHLGDEMTRFRRELKETYPDAELRGPGPVVRAAAKAIREYLKGGEDPKIDVVLPEAAPMRGCEQSPFHHLDVFEHTLQVLDAAADIGAHPEHYLGRHAESLRQALDETVGDELDQRTALRLAVLFHDIEKPATRTVSRDGRIGFMGHDQRGAETAGRILKRWRAATATIRFCALLVAEHLRLGFMVHDRPLGRREGYRYMRATAPYTRASVVVSLADRLATRGVRARQSYVRAHAETADELLTVVAELEREARPPLLRGDEIAELTGAEGPRIGELVAALAEEQAAGTVTTRDEAVAFVRG